MSLDAGVLGRVTAELMEHLEDQYSADETAHITEVMVVVAVRTDQPPRPPEEGEDPETWSFIHLRGSESAWHRQLGLLHAGILGIEDR